MSVPVHADDMQGDMLPERALPPGARRLGVKAKPIIRLGMGFKDPERGFPRKTEYLTVRGDQRAVAKFRDTYGEKPKTVEIMVPATLNDALTIRYLAFVGAGADDPDGGRMAAYGHTNFALEDYMGGPDTLTVFTADGEVVEREIDGLDDETARELGVELVTTFRFGIPAVLGWGSFAEISSKGKESADNLWFKLREIYAAFGARAPLAVKPQLVLKPSTVMTTFEKDGKRRWGKTKVFVLDIVLPETLDDMLDRLRTRQEAIGNPADAVYGTARELPAGPLAAPQPSTVSPDLGSGDVPSPGEADSGANADGSASPAPLGDDDIEEAEIVDEPPAPGDPGAFRLTFGRYKDASLHTVATVGVALEGKAATPDPGYVEWLADTFTAKSEPQQQAKEAARAYLGRIA